MGVREEWEGGRSGKKGEVEKREWLGVRRGGEIKGCCEGKYGKKEGVGRKEGEKKKGWRQEMVGRMEGWGEGKWW